MTRIIRQELGHIGSPYPTAIMFTVSALLDPERPIVVLSDSRIPRYNGVRVPAQIEAIAADVYEHFAAQNIDAGAIRWFEEVDNHEHPYALFRVTFGHVRPVSAGLRILFGLSPRAAAFTAPNWQPVDDWPPELNWYHPFLGHRGQGVFPLPHIPRSAP